MPPPKRPFTTSSLTSTLKSTIASQPLLSNSIDKLSSQASSLAHKTPFFGPQTNLEQQHQSDAGASTNMMRSQGAATSQVAPQQQPQQPQQKAPMATTPTVDMSHLTEEERLMIQSVMAKAEMADMGIPVDTSVPSSTNMPSNASQALVQQQQHHQLQLQQQQQQQNRQNLQNQRPQNQQDFLQQRMNDNSNNDYLNSQNVMHPFNQQNFQTYQPVNPIETQSAPMNSGMLNSRNPLPPQGQQNQQQLEQVNQQFLLQQQQQLKNQQQLLNSQNVSQQFVNKQQLEQQSRLQDATGINNYEQAMISQNQALYSADTQQQVQNSMVLQQQQAQYQQQSQMIIEQQNIQKNQVLQSDYSGQESVLIGQIQRNQAIDSATKQSFVQQPNINNVYAGNTVVQNPNQLEQMRLNSNTNSFDLSNFPDNSIRSNIVPQLQSDFHNTGLMNQRADQLRFSNTSSTNQQAINFNTDKSQQQAQAYTQEQYRNVRGEIRFGNQQMQTSLDLNDHALSDQEYNGGHARKHNRPSHNNRRNESLDMNEHRATRNDDYYSRDQIDPRDRNLQAYDLANRSPQNFTRPMNAPHNRQLPQPNLHSDRSLQSSNEHVPASERPNSRSRDVKQKVSNRKPYRQESKKDSPPYLSGSDQEEEEEEEIVEKKKDANKKSPIEPNKQNADKNDEALRLLSELKLIKTEQANEMMKQQQLLIKQSQELIKLQLEQQALSQGIKKSINAQNLSTTNNSEQTDSKNQDQDAESHTESKETEIDREFEKDSREIQAKQKLDGIKNDQEEVSSLRNTRLELSKKSTSFCNDSDIEEHSTSKPTSTRLNNLIEEDSRSSVGDRRIESNEKGKATSRKSNVNQGYTQNSYSQTCASPRYNRDLLQSPTDTTDSDIEPISNIRRNQKLIQAKSKNSVLRRREPTGLPPSPLPVAAAIQLHQMQQQQQSKQAASSLRGTNMTRANFLRSRSVTSSPNHHLEHMNSGYMTDNQRNRSVSPDTLSEFGGQRRRKRLPEPPTNAVPITPSMVRKMIQAQKTGSVSGRGLLNSVNAQSTFLTNTHATRSLSHDLQHSTDSQNPSRNYTFNGTTSGNFQQHSSTSANNPAPLNELSTSIHNTDNTSGMSTSGDSDLNKFLSSTYGNSILRNNISDVKDTPELDKLISKLDDYYGLDGKGNIRLPKASDVHLSADTYNQTLNVGPSVTSSALSPTRTIGQNYSGYSAKSSYHSNNNNPLMRCNSEGEYSLTSRLANRRPYRPPTFDEYRSIKDTSLTTSSYPERPSSYLGLSPNKQSRYRPSLPVSQRLRDYQSSIGDHWTNQPSSSKFDSTYHYNRPMQFSSRLHNPTGSFDSEHLDYIAATTTSADLRPYTSTLSDDLRNNTRYQTRFSGTDTIIDSIRNKYRYSGVQDLSKYDRSEFNNSSPLRYQNSHLSELRRPYASSRQNVGLTQQKSLDFDSRRVPLHIPKVNPTSYELRARDFQPNDYPEPMIDSTSYLGDSARINSSPLGSFGQDYRHQSNFARDIPSRHNITSSSFAPLTKDDIINNGPKFNSIGYRFRTENQNKYVAQARTPIQCLQSRYPYPYKRILLSKNPKDRIGNGIGVRITGGRPLANLFDKVNRCIVTSGAFVTEVFQNSNVYFMGELNEGDQIIEWNGVNLCNRSDEEVQQILLSQFSDDEVEIVYLHLNKLKEAYIETDVELDNNKNYLTQRVEQDQFDVFAEINKSCHQSSPSPPLTSRGRYISEASKGSIRRKLSLSSIAHMWSK